MIKVIENFPNYTISTEGSVTMTVSNVTKKLWVGANGYLHVDLSSNGFTKKVSLHRLLAKHFLPNSGNKRTVNHIDGNKLNNSLCNLEWSTDSENLKHAYDTGLRSCQATYTNCQLEDILTNMYLKGITLVDISFYVGLKCSALSVSLRKAAARLGLTEEYKSSSADNIKARHKLVGVLNTKTIRLQMINEPTGDVVRTFRSLKEAKDFLGVSSSGPISNVLSGRQKRAYKYLWKKV
jgi:hypothetical protein